MQRNPNPSPRCLAGSIRVILWVVSALAFAALLLLPGRRLFLPLASLDKPEITPAPHDARGAEDTDLEILFPFDGSVFPPEIAPPRFSCKDLTDHVNTWAVRIEFDDGNPPMKFACDGREWTPSDDVWHEIRNRSMEADARVTVCGFDRWHPEEVLSRGGASIRTSRDGVGAPIFYREVNLPFLAALKDPASHIRWRFGPVSSRSQPPVVLRGLPVCGNCHSFSADGTVLGMDVDYANDKGSYAICPVNEQVCLSKDRIISWCDFRPEDEKKTFGFLSQVSPDGRHVIGTVKDLSVFLSADDIAFSQLFFPIRGILCTYDRAKETFRSLPGADDERYVQSNPTWSPDGKYIVFARCKAYAGKETTANNAALTREESDRFLAETETFRYDLYRIPFNDGRGGQAEPLEGASCNGRSNYFARYSPDGRWIVFCQANSFMLLRPDSELYIVPAEGGEARRLCCNAARMNSWHSWSPNGRWLVFSSKAFSPYTQLFLAHMDEEGHASPPVVLSRFTAPDRAANIPEFVNAPPGAIKWIREDFLEDTHYLRAGEEFRKQGDFAGALRLYGRALELNPNSAKPHVNIGICLHAMGKREEAEASLRHAVELQPDLALAHCNLGIVLQDGGKVQEAIAAYREAIRLVPDLAPARVYLGTLLLEQGKHDEAIPVLTEAVQVAPHDPFARFNLAIALLDAKKPREAANHLEGVIERASGFVPAMVSLAILRATSDDAELRNGEQAVELASRARSLIQQENPEILHALAAGYAEVGRFEDATATAELAVRAARAAGNPNLADAIEHSLGFYRQNKPFRDSYR